MALRYIGVGMRYTNGTGTNQFFSNADVELTLGQVRSTTSPFTGGSLFSPRVWNGTIYYSTSVIPEPRCGLAMMGIVGLVLGGYRRRLA